MASLLEAALCTVSKYCARVRERGVKERRAKGEGRAANLLAGVLQPRQVFLLNLLQPLGLHLRHLARVLLHARSPLALALCI
jgi:hypothetical protein